MNIILGREPTSSLPAGVACAKVAEMRKAISSFAVFVLFAAAPAAAAETPSASPPAVESIGAPPTAVAAVNPITLYGPDMAFDVLRNGKKVGDQTMTFARDGVGDLHVKVQFHIEIDILFIKGAYTFDYSAAEIWRDNQMISMAAQVNDNGKAVKTMARLEGGVFKIEGSQGTTFTDHWLFPTNHWHHGQVDATSLLNTLTGKVVRVTIARKGIDNVETAQGSVEAEHFTYNGDLHDIDVWYDIAGRWVKMSFKAKDGSVIEYICRKCGLLGQP